MPTWDWTLINDKDNFDKFVKLIVEPGNEPDYKAQAIAMVEHKIKEKKLDMERIATYAQSLQEKLNGIINL